MELAKYIYVQFLNFVFKFLPITFYRKILKYISKNAKIFLKRNDVNV